MDTKRCISNPRAPLTRTPGTINTKILYKASVTVAAKFAPAQSCVGTDMALYKPGANVRERVVVCKRRYYVIIY